MTILERASYWSVRDQWAKARILGDIYPEEGPSRPSPSQVMGAILCQVYAEAIDRMFTMPSPLLKGLEPSASS